MTNNNFPIFCCETPRLQMSLLFAPCQQLDQKRVTKNVLESKPQGRRTMVRPRFRLTEDVGNDLRQLKVNR
jgi:hypothetical protein